MRTFLDVMLPESNKSLSRLGLGHFFTQRMAMLSLFSTRLLQSVSMCSSHPQHDRHRWLESTSSGAQNRDSGLQAIIVDNTPTWWECEHQPGKGR